MCTRVAFPVILLGLARVQNRIKTSLPRFSSSLCCFFGGSRRCWCISIQRTCAGFIQRHMSSQHPKERCLLKGHGGAQLGELRAPGPQGLAHQSITLSGRGCAIIAGTPRAAGAAERKRSVPAARVCQQSHGVPHPVAQARQEQRLLRRRVACRRLLLRPKLRRRRIRAARSRSSSVDPPRPSPASPGRRPSLATRQPCVSTGRRWPTSPSMWPCRCSCSSSRTLTGAPQRPS